MTEVRDLQRANPSPAGRAPQFPATTRVIGRGSIVLLYSHFERYVRAVNEEAVLALNASAITQDRLSLNMRLHHSRRAVDEVVETGWDKREGVLKEFAARQAWLWSPGGTGLIDAGRLVDWLDTVDGKKLIRYYNLWGIADIFSAITRKTTTRTDLWLRIDELVSKRHRIAHGDPTAEATQREVQLYVHAALEFATRADRVLAKVVAGVATAAEPW